jgi:AraC family transcriptional regulator, transcriptional activator of pobA
MTTIRTFSLSTHSKLFSVPDNNNRDYLFVEAGETPYQEEPYRAESYAIAYIKEGVVKLTVGLSSWEVHAPSIITLAPSFIRFFSKRSESLKMDVIFFKDTYLLERHVDRFFLGKFGFFEDGDRCLLPLKGAAAVTFAGIFELLRSAQAKGSSNQQELTRAYIFALIYEIDVCHRQDLSGGRSLPKGYPLVAKFKQLLSQHYIRERKLDFYAGHLHVTPKSLSAAVKKQTGRSAGKWIDDTVVLEAKVLLQNNLLTVSQVSDMLNFSDQSVFGKFFRAATGISPVEYRKSFN